ncbi:hypothetical protein JSY14_00720 [Brachybacterium sp. EF45031]|uniref:hypothetical protein n=1 Tax=Brachybacterium sillae TaxID=2810536 RepID=UPI00217E06E0|nr:hypothetical protein [Brachybacterium sillae]MCS6710613.1 hypothetical protein [Brachybacterium sillae]
MTATRHTRGSIRPPVGAVLRLPLTHHADDHAEVRVLVDLRRLPVDLPPAPVDLFGLMPGGMLVDVRVRGRVVIPGAWADGASLAALEVTGEHAVRPADLRLPAVVLETPRGRALAWGETLWPLPLAADVLIPDSCRPGVHSAAELRRLAMVAAGRTAELGLTLWQSRDFDVPWHDVRLVPRAAWWFDLAQVPPGMRYADAAASQQVPVTRLLPADTSA